MRDFYSQFLGKDDVAFDVGAFMGSRTRVFADLCRLTIAVEPQPHHAEELRKEFEPGGKVKVVAKALGSAPGSAEMSLNESISSLSRGWTDATYESGRFHGRKGWGANGIITVEITTLEALIGEFGVPAFIKIDVEGYEYEVLKGLLRPVQALSFEFTPFEWLQDAFKCIGYLNHIGMARFNYSLGESMAMELPDWVPSVELAGRLARYRDNVTFGDIYAIRG